MLSKQCRHDSHMFHLREFSFETAARIFREREEAVFQRHIEEFKFERIDVKLRDEREDDSSKKASLQ